MNKEDQVIAGFRDVYNKMAWLNTQAMKDSLQGVQPSEVHCIEYIGANEDVNVTKLAEAFYMTLGAISKLTKKLAAKGLIESYQRPDNKKEVYFRLTAQGKAIDQRHTALHKAFRARDKAVFDQISEAQLDSLLRFAAQYSRHLDAEIKKQRAVEANG